MHLTHNIPNRRNILKIFIQIIASSKENSVVLPISSHQEYLLFLKTLYSPHTLRHGLKNCTAFPFSLHLSDTYPPDRYWQI